MLKIYSSEENNSLGEIIQQLSLDMCKSNPFSPDKEQYIYVIIKGIELHKTEQSDTIRNGDN